MSRNETYRPRKQLPRHLRSLTGEQTAQRQPDRSLTLVPADHSLEMATQNLLAAVASGRLTEKNARPFVNELVRRATQESYDLGGILEIFFPAATERVAVSANPEGKKIATELMDGISNYMKGQKLVVKSVFPLEDYDDLLSGDAYHRLIGKYNIETLFPQILDPKSSIQLDDFWQLLITRIQRSDSDAISTGEQMVFYDRNHLNPADMMPSTPSAIMRALVMSPDNHTPQNIQECAIGLLNYAREKNHKEKISPDLQFGGVSLGDVIDMPFGPDYTKKVLEFISHVPKGNILWQNIVNYLFLFERDLSNVHEYGEFQDYAEKVVAFQMDLASQLFGPALAAEEGETVYPINDKALGDVLHALHPFYYGKFISMLFRTAQKTPEQLAMLKMRGHNMEHIHPLDTPLKGQEKDSPRVVAARIIKSIPQIQENWDTRFALGGNNEDPYRQALRGRRINALQAEIEHIASSEYAQFHASKDGIGYFMHLSRERRFREFIHSVSSQTVQAEHLLPADRLAELGIQPAHLCSFYCVKIHPENPLTTLIGYHTITIAIPRTPGKAVLFGMLGQTNQETIAGALRYDGTLGQVFTPTTPQLQSLLQSTIAEAYRQMLIETEQQNHPALLRPVEDFEPRQLYPDDITPVDASEAMGSVLDDLFE